MTVMEQQPRVRRSFTDEFKRDAVGLTIEQKRSIVDVAGSLGVVRARNSVVRVIENASLQVRAAGCRYP